MDPLQGPYVPGDADDPVARAEQALSELSSEFTSWMDQECERLDKARILVSEGGFTEASKEALFAATSCEETPFPWQRSAARATRLGEALDYLRELERANG